ncbi:MAG: PEP-CTERM sorting domain-containing protein [Planctomycetota bacterium]|nr:PEP-CTERM sorting domain-containing protein [Planctomycetota bacterium]
MSAKLVGSVVVAASVFAVLLAGAPAQAAVVVFQENFNSYGSGTLLTGAPGWVLQSGSDLAFVNASGKAESSTGQAALWLAMPDAFGLGNSQARIEFDSSSFHQEDIRFGAGNAATKTWDPSPRQRFGWQHGNGILSISSGGGWSGTYYIPAGDANDNPFAAHYVFDLTRDAGAGTLTWTATADAGAGTLTWTATADGVSLFSPAKVITGLTMNPFDTIYWNPWQPGSTLDNFTVTAIDATPEPATLSLLVLGGLALLRRGRRA